MNSANRAWNDANRNYVPDCDLSNFAANGECAAIDNRNFGQNNPLAVRWDEAVLRGWHVRDSNWDFSAEVQHELRPNLAVSGGYYRNTGGYAFSASSNLAGVSGLNTKVRKTDNLSVTPQDFDPYCITAPRDPRLPGGGGYQVCGLHDLKPDKFGQVVNLITRKSNFGKDTRFNDFFNISLDARLGDGIRIGGGFDTGRSVSDRCFVIDSPQDLLYCRVVTPFKAQTQLKLHGAIPLPGDVVASFAYQNLSGPALDAEYAATNAEIAPSLGRNLAGGARTATVPLVAPQTLFEGRTTRLDLRLSKIFRVGRFRVQANLDAYNALNTSSILSVINTYGPRWLQPASILDPRVIEVGGQISF